MNVEIVVEVVVEESVDFGFGEHVFTGGTEQCGGRMCC